jgi:hypothetical protein
VIESPDAVTYRRDESHFDFLVSRTRVRARQTKKISARAKRGSVGHGETPQLGKAPPARDFNDAHRRRARAL